MTNVSDMSPDASDDEDFQPLNAEEYAPFVDLKTLLNRPAHLSIFLNFAIMEKKPNYLLFVLCVHHFQRQEKFKDCRKAANEIFTDFLNPSAVLRVSFPQDVLSDISIRLQQNPKDPRQLQTIYNRALHLATRTVNELIAEFKTKLDMGLGNAYNVQALQGLHTFEDEKKVAKQILIDKFEELMKDTNDLHEEKNKALIAAVQYFLEDIGVLHGSANIARSFSMNKRDVEKVARKLHSLRKDTNKGLSSITSSLSTLNPKQRDPLSPGMESDGSRDNLSPSSDHSTSNSASRENVDQLDGHHYNNHNNNRLQPTDAPVKRWKSLPRDHSVIPKRPEHGPHLRPKSAAEDTDLFVNDGLRQRPSSEEMSSNSSDGSNRSPFTDVDPRRTSKNLIVFEPDPDLEIPDEMTLWSQTHSQLIKTRSMPKKAVQRQDVIHEFIHTEQHYVRKLKILNVVYYNPLQEHDIIEKVQVVWLFPNLDELIKIHKEFCNKLLKRKELQCPVEEITDIIIEHLSSYDLKKACATFCNHQRSALAMFKNSYQNSQELRSFCIEAELHPVSKRLGLDQLVGCVLQRITKYPLLLEEVKKCTKDEYSQDFKRINDAIKLAKDIACFVNMRIKETENAARLEKLQKNIDNQILEEMSGMGHLYNMRINAPHRKLMFDRSLTLMIDKTHTLELLGLLMTDCLVLLQKQDARYLLKPLSHELSSSKPKAPVIMLQDIHLSTIDKREKRFIIMNKNPRTPDLYELRCNNKDQKEKWTTSIQFAMQEYQGGKLKHLSEHDFPRLDIQARHSSSGSFVKSDTDDASDDAESESSSESEAPSEDSERETDSDDNNDKTDTTIDNEPDPPTPPAKPTSSSADSEESPMTPTPTPSSSSKETLTADSRASDSATEQPRTTSNNTEPVRDELSELTSRDLILKAMNDAKNIQKLSLDLDREGGAIVRQNVQRSVGTLNKNLRVLLTSVISDNQHLQNVKQTSDARIAQLEALLARHGIAYE